MFSDPRWRASRQKSLQFEAPAPARAQSASQISAQTPKELMRRHHAKIATQIIIGS
jgi:hypothetical protein